MQKLERLIALLPEGGMRRLYEERLREIQRDGRPAMQHALDSGRCREQLAEDSVPWILREWRRVSIPQWRGILQQAEITADDERASYARWMLNEVLKADDG